MKAAKPSATAVSVELEVPFHDVDALRVVWHGWYCKYLEIARTALLRARSLDVPNMIQLGYRFLVVETRLRHLKPATYGDRLKITAWFTEVESRLDISYVVENAASGQRVALGSTSLVTTDGDNALCYQTPEPILQRLRAPGPGQFV